MKSKKNEKYESIRRCVGQYINLLENDVMHEYGLECFEAWCEDGEVFNHKEIDVQTMRELAPHFDRLSNEIENAMLRASEVKCEVDEI